MALGRYLRSAAACPSVPSPVGESTPDALLVLAPLKIEALTLGRARRLRIERTGMGPRESTRAVKRLADARASRVAVAGFCGGLDPDLQPGDVVVADEVRGPHGTTPCEHTRLLEILRSMGVRAVSGPIVSVDHMVLSEEERRVLHRTGAKAVDMESAWLAGLAHNRRLAVVRVVVDTPGRGLVRAGSPLTGGTRAWRTLLEVGRTLEIWARD